MRELASDPSDQYCAAPLEDNMFEWHFTIRGPPDTEFEGGCYHGRILLPADYPFKPPDIIFLTPNGRFQVNTKVCLSISAYHPEFWQPAWGIRLILEALISFLPTPADGAIGSLSWSVPERKRLAKLSTSFHCMYCGNTADLLPKLKGSKNVGSKYKDEIANLHIQQFAAHGEKSEEKKEMVKEDDVSEDTAIEDEKQIISSTPLGREGSNVEQTDSSVPKLPHDPSPVSTAPDSATVIVGDDATVTSGGPVNDSPVLPQESVEISTVNGSHTATNYDFQVTVFLTVLCIGFLVYRKIQLVLMDIHISDEF